MIDRSAAHLAGPDGSGLMRGGSELVPFGTAARSDAVAMTIQRRSRREWLAPRLIGLAFMLGGSLLAFRWASPLGNITLSRIGVLGSVAFLAVRLRQTALLPRSARPALYLAAAVVGSLTMGLMWTPAPATGVVILGNFMEALLIFVVVVLVATGALRRRGEAAAGTSKMLARIPLWGYLPTGLIGLQQAFQLLRGEYPTVPFLSLANISALSINSSRTSFGTGLNMLGLDRVAAATGDPSTFGIFSAVTLAFILWARRRHVLTQPWLFWIVSALSVIGVVLSASTSALLVLIVALLFNAQASVRSLKQLTVGGVMSALLLVSIVNLVPQAGGFVASARERISGTAEGQGSAVPHLGLLSQAWDVFGNAPVLGVGTGGFSFHQYGYDPGFSSAHNVLWLALAEGGVVLGALIGLFWLLLGWRLVPLGVLAPAIVGWLVYLDFNRLPALWAVLGIAAALNVHLRRTAPNSDLARESKSSAGPGLAAAGAGPHRGSHYPAARGSTPGEAVGQRLFPA